MIKSGQYWALKEEEEDRLTSWPRFIMILHQWPTNKDMFCCLSLSGFYQFMADLVGSFWLSYDKDTFLVLNQTDETIQHWTILSAREGVAKITFGFLMSQKRISDA